MSALPNGWIAASLEEVAQVNPRLDKSEIDADLEVSFVPMPAVEAESGKIDVSAKRRFSEVEKGYTGFKENDVLFAKITPCMENGKMAVVPEVHGGLGFGSTEFHVLRPPEGIVPKYLYYFVSSKSFRMNAEHNMTGAVGQRRVPTTYFSQADIPLPPLAEQRRIVGKVEELFSELDEGVANLKQARAQLAVYRQALLKHAFEGHLTADWRTKHAPELESADQLLARLLQERRTKWKGRGRYSEPEPPKTENQGSLPEQWVWASPEQLSSFENYSLAIGPFGSNLKVSDYKEAGVPLVFVRNIRSSQFRGVRTIYVTPGKAEELRAHSVSGGDILITKMGEPPGDAAIYPKSEPDAVITADCIKLRLSPLLTHSRYFLHAINSGMVRQQIINISSGVAQQKVSLGRFSSIAIPLPPLAEQERIVNELDAQLSAIDVVEADIDLNLQKAEALRQSILKKAFAGELVPQDPADEPAAALLARIRAEREAATARPKTKQAGKRPAKLT